LPTEYRRAWPAVPSRPAVAATSAAAGCCHTTREGEESEVERDIEIERMELGGD